MIFGLVLVFNLVKVFGVGLVFIFFFVLFLLKMYGWFIWIYYEFERFGCGIWVMD